jgi:hypothetical protein
MKLVLLAIGLALSVVSTNSMASGCDPRDSGSEVIGSMEITVSGELVCVAGNVCVLDVEGSDLKLTGAEISPIDGKQYLGSLPGTITREKFWGSCEGNFEHVRVEVVIKGQKFTGNLSSHSDF